MTPLGRLLRSLLVVGAAYFAAGRVGLAVPFTAGNVSPMWPAAGIALAAVTIVGYRVWPAITIAAFMVNVLTPIPAWSAAGIAVGNTAGPLAGAWLLRRTGPFDPALGRLRDVFALILAGAFGGTALSATVGTGVLAAGHAAAWPSPLATWLMWWRGDAMGVLVAAPLVLSLPSLPALLGGKRPWELAALVALAVTCSLLVCQAPPDARGARYGVIALTFPFLLMWGATRFEVVGASIITACITSVAVWSSRADLDPFAVGTPVRSATLMQFFITVIAVSGMSVAGLIVERTRLIQERAEREQKRREAEGRASREEIVLLTRAVEQTADSVIVTDRRGVIQYVNPAFEATTGYAPDEAVGRTPAILKSGRHDTQFYERMWGELLEGRSYRGILANRKKDGAFYWAEQTITPIRSDEGEITHFVSVLKDVTDLRRQHEQEVQLRVAHEVQRRFYQNPVAVDGLELAAACHPAAETGGDYFDFVPAPDGAVYVAIGDASGHGLGAALVMALTRASVRSLAALNLDVAEVLTRVNGMLVGDLEEHRFVTLLLARIDTRGRLLQYANAGHVPGVVLGSDGAAPAAMPATGVPLGLFPASVFESRTLAFGREDVLLLVTDGVTESERGDGDQFGPERVLASASACRDRPACAIADAVCQASRRFADGEPQADDLTAVVVKMTGDDVARSV